MRPLAVANLDRPVTAAALSEIQTSAGLYPPKLCCRVADLY